MIGNGLKYCVHMEPIFLRRRFYNNCYIYVSVFSDGCYLAYWYFEIITIVLGNEHWLEIILKAVTLYLLLVWMLFHYYSLALILIHYCD